MKHRQWTIVLVAALVGLVDTILLFPAVVQTADPPICRGLFFYSVPCDGWVAPFVGIVVALLTGYGLWLLGSSLGEGFVRPDRRKKVLQQ
jgi:hypothetical protein